MLGIKQLEKVMCVACNLHFGEHSKNGLIRCAFRLQGTLVGEAIENKPAPSKIEDQE